MDKQELIDFLRENLTIENWVDTTSDTEGEYLQIITILKLGDEEISRSYDSTKIA